ncbi:hypothetical protein HJG60_010068 [Phyllostomus discolor]|uniref:Uncharacterized protein n=1 Tax=Phyllostomus discolor TaxID=89673 RepID=A0A834AYL2_9CHIR|nr:hypothetical protein HJG60_010068 [Phyllostomus discolor]
MIVFSRVCHKWNPRALAFWPSASFPGASVPFHCSGAVPYGVGGPSRVSPCTRGWPHSFFTLQHLIDRCSRTESVQKNNRSRDEECGLRRWTPSSELSIHVRVGKPRDLCLPQLPHLSNGCNASAHLIWLL